MAYNEVNEDNVYLCVGHPARKDIENIVRWMLNDNFATAYNRIFYCIAFQILISCNLVGRLVWLNHKGWVSQYEPCKAIRISKFIYLKMLDNNLY